MVYESLGSRSPPDPVKDKVVGMRLDLQEVTDARILNRIVRVTSAGWEHDTDRRHADIIIKELELTTAKATKTHGEDEPSWKMERGRRTIVSRFDNEIQGTCS